ncbi:MAG: MlaD family protein [Gemmatimonadota bacterium]|nr:MlaD family protein [Gemmatimonadota bacterium]
MSARANPTLIGGFVLGGVILAVLATVVLGSGQLFRDTRTFISFFDGSVAGLDVGAPVRFRGIDVGTVSDVLLDLPSVERESADLRIAVIYEVDRERVEARGAGARLEDPLDIDALLELGIRAELSTESLVTGRKYIALDLDPENPVPMVPVAGALYPEIPTVSTGLERIEDEVYGIIAELGAVQLDALVNVAAEAFGDVGALAGSPELSAAIERLPETIDRLNATVGDLQALVIRVDSSLTPMSEGVRQTTERATSAMERLETTLQDVGVVVEGVGDVLEPESPVFVQFERAMIDLSDATRALRNLADYLERNPSALLRGRPGGDR